jgi:hypothetical protein
MKIKIGRREEDSKMVAVGDVVGFKDDIEQSGQIIEIKEGQSGYRLVLENEWGFEGEFLEGETVVTVYAHDCWSL